MKGGRHLRSLRPPTQPIALRAHQSQSAAASTHTHTQPTARPLHTPTSLGSQNQAQRMLRRLPVGRTTSTFYFNELSRPIKGAVLQQLHRLRELEASPTHPHAPPLEDEISVVELKVPQLRMSTTALQHAFNQTDKLAQQLLRHPRGAGEDDDGRLASRNAYVQALRGLTLPARCDNGEGQDGTGGSRTLCEGAGGRVAAILSEATVLVPYTADTVARLGVRRSVPAPAPPPPTGDPAGEKTSPSQPFPRLLLTTESTAPRVDYSALPDIYMLAIPYPALPGKRTAEGDLESGGPTGWAGEGDELETLLRSRLVFDTASGQLLLVSSATGADDLHLSQMYAFDALKASEAAAYAAAATASDTRRRQGYRLVFLSPRLGLLTSMGRAFPSSFRSYTVDMPTVERLLYPPEGPGAASEAALQPPPALWTRVRAKRLTAAPGEAGEATLWSTQTSPEAAVKAAAPLTPSHAKSTETLEEPHLQYLRSAQQLLRQRAEELVWAAAAQTTPESGTHPTADRADTGEAVSSSALELGPYGECLRRMFGGSHEGAGLGPPPPTRSPRGTRIPVCVLEPILHRRPPPQPQPRPSLADEVSAALYDGWRVPPTTMDAAMAVRERVLLPFLVHPVALESQTSEAAAVAAHTRDGQPRRLYRLGELDALAAWRARGHHASFGELVDLLGVSTGGEESASDGVVVLVGDDYARGGDDAGPLILYNDTAFVETVLLPHLSLYAARHCGHCPETSLYLWQAHGGPPLSARATGSVTRTSIAVAAHYRRILAAWQSRARAGEGPSAGAGGRVPGLAVVPILPFLQWACERGDSAGARRSPLTLTAEHLVVALRYLAGHSDLLDVLHGDRTTVAFIQTVQDARLTHGSGDGKARFT